MKIPIIVEGGDGAKKPIVVAYNTADGKSARGSSLDAASLKNISVPAVMFPTTLKLPERGCWKVTVTYEEDSLDFNVHF